MCPVSRFSIDFGYPTCPNDCSRCVVDAKLSTEVHDSTLGLECCPLQPKSSFSNIVSRHAEPYKHRHCKDVISSFFSTLQHGPLTGPRSVFKLVKDKKDCPRGQSRQFQKHALIHSVIAK